MADNTVAKSHLTTVESTLTNLDDVNNLRDLVNATSLKLYNTLGGQNLLVDSAIIDSLRRIRNDLVDGEMGARVSGKIAGLTAERAILLPGGRNATRIAEIGQKIDSLHEIANDAGNVAANVTHRHNEYHDLHEAASRFQLGTNLTNLDVNIAATPRTGTTNIQLKVPFVTAAHPDPSYELCDDKGDKLTKVGSDYQVQVGGQTYTLGGITLGANLDCTNITIDPNPTALPLNIKLSVNASYPVNVGLNTINVTCNKKLNLNLNDGTPALNNHNDREREFNAYNNSLGTYHPIAAQLDTKINVRNNDPEVGKNVLERKAIETALKYKGGTKYDTLSEKQKRLFYERVCRAGFFTGVYELGGVISVGVPRYENMREWFIHGSRPWNNDNNITGSASAYKTYIHSHLDEKCDEYILSTLESYLQEDARNTELKAELSSFLEEIDRNKLDDNHVNTQIHEDLDDDRYKMKKGPRSLFHPRDVNYMRFFSNSATSLKNQKVDIYSNIDNQEPVNYDMDLRVTGKNSIEVEVKIAGTDEVIKQKSSEPSTLVRKIMRDQRIKHGKVRAHIGFNIYKSIIQIAKDKNINLSYRGVVGKEGERRRNGRRSSPETRKIDIDKSGNIVVKQINHLTTSGTEKDEIIFDQNSFLNANEFDNGQTNGRLREGLETLGYHFNLAMDDFHKQYRNGTEKRVGGLLHSKNRMKLPTSFWLSPIKKILNLKTNTNFDFNTSVNAGGRDIKIDFRKNKFTITTTVIDVKSKKEKKEKTITISSRDLGKLLNHREGKVRIFDGVERDIVAEVYSSLIGVLRTNAKIARTSFGVVDDITGNMYVLDEDGKFGVIAREDFKGANKVNNPLRGIFRRLKKMGSLKKSRFNRVARRPLEPSEEKELLKNPFLMQKFVKAMNNRMGLWGSLTALFN